MASKKGMSICKECGKIAFFDDEEQENKEYQKNPDQFCEYRGVHTKKLGPAKTELMNLIGKDLIDQLARGRADLDLFVEPGTITWRRAKAIILAAHQEIPVCPHCQSRGVKSGFSMRKDRKIQRYMCTGCGVIYHDE